MLRSSRVSNRCNSKQKSSGQPVAPGFIDSRRVFVMLCVVCQSSQFSIGFSQFQSDTRWNHVSQSSPSLLNLVFDSNAEIDKGLQRARAVLEKSKAKLAAKESSSESCIPFFATQQSKRTVTTRDCVVKFKDEKTGLVTADGERLAQISEEEQWERRSLLEVFDDESEKYKESSSITSSQLASRDMVADISNLRKELQRCDYETIFDKKNIFIGEDN